MTDDLSLRVNAAVHPLVNSRLAHAWTERLPSLFYNPALNHIVGLPAIERLIHVYTARDPQHTELIIQGRQTKLPEVLEIEPNELAHAAVRLSQYYTIILNQFVNTHRLYEKVAEFLGRSLRAKDYGGGMFICTNNTPGFYKHADQYDNVVFHQEGTCVWYLYDPRTGQLWQRLTLTPGKILFVPEGWGHEVERITSRTVHVTIALGYR